MTTSRVQLQTYRQTSLKLVCTSRLGKRAVALFRRTRVPETRRFTRSFLHSSLPALALFYSTELTRLSNVFRHQTILLDVLFVHLSVVSFSIDCLSSRPALNMDGYSRSVLYGQLFPFVHSETFMNKGKGTGMAVCTFKR